MYFKKKSTWQKADPTDGIGWIIKNQTDRLMAGMARRDALRAVTHLAVAACLAGGLASAAPRSRHPADAAVSLSRDAKLVNTEIGTSAVLVYLSRQELVGHAEYRLSGELAPVSDHARGVGMQRFNSSFTKKDVEEGMLLLEVAHAVKPDTIYRVAIWVTDAAPGLSAEDALLALRRQIVQCCGLMEQFGASPQATPTVMGALARHPADSPVTLSFDTKLITSEVDAHAALIVFLKEHELSDAAEYTITATLMPVPGDGLIYKVNMPDRTFSKRHLVKGQLNVDLGPHNSIPAGTFTLTLAIHDAFPGLAADDALLAVRRNLVRCCPRNDRVIINLGLPKTGSCMWGEGRERREREWAEGAHFVRGAEAHAICWRGVALVFAGALQVWIAGYRACSEVTGCTEQGREARAMMAGWIREREREQAGSPPTPRPLAWNGAWSSC